MPISFLLTTDSTDLSSNGDAVTTCGGNEMNVDQNRMDSYIVLRVGCVAKVERISIILISAAATLRLVCDVFVMICGSL